MSDFHAGCLSRYPPPCIRTCIPHTISCRQSWRHFHIRSHERSTTYTSMGQAVTPMLSARQGEECKVLDMRRGYRLLSEAVEHTGVIRARPLFPCEHASRASAGSRQHTTSNTQMQQRETQQSWHQRTWTAHKGLVTGDNGNS